MARPVFCCKPLIVALYYPYGHVASLDACFYPQERVLALGDSQINLEPNHCLRRTLFKQLGGCLWLCILYVTTWIVRQAVDKSGS